MMPEYRAIEKKLMKVIAEKFGFPWPLPKEVKKVDADFLNIEWAGFVMKQDVKFKDGVLEYWPWEKAKQAFLWQYEFLKSKDKIRKIKASEV